MVNSPSVNHSSLPSHPVWNNARQITVPSLAWKACLEDQTKVSVVEVLNVVWCMRPCWVGFIYCMKHIERYKGIMRYSDLPVYWVDYSHLMDPTIVCFGHSLNCIRNQQGIHDLDLFRILLLCYMRLYYEFFYHFFFNTLYNDFFLSPFFNIVYFDFFLYTTLWLFSPKFFNILYCLMTFQSSNVIKNGILWFIQ